MGLNLKSLIAKLNDQTRGALEGAAGLCLSRTNYDIEVEHFLTKLLESSSGDFAAIIKHFEIDKSRLTSELARSMDKLKSGNARTPAISPTVLKMLTTAWTIGSIDFNAGSVRTGFVILALASDEDLAAPHARSQQGIPEDQRRRIAQRSCSASSRSLRRPRRAARPSEPERAPETARSRWAARPRTSISTRST